MNAQLRFALKEAMTLPFHALGLCLRPFRARAIRRLWHLGNLRARVGWVSPRLQLDGPVIVAGTGRITFPRVARLGPDVYLETCGRGRIVLGENVRLNQGTVIVAYDRVEVGRDTLVGEYVTLRDANHGLRPGAPIRNQPHEARPVHIGEDVWIGRGVCVLAGVTIGRGAVVGANSVVNRALPPYAVAAGIPARVVRSREARGLRLET
jgi:acetyltransferase-like isoleucine patch superfamily enzyme